MLVCCINGVYKTLRRYLSDLSRRRGITRHPGGDFLILAGDRSSRATGTTPPLSCHAGRELSRRELNEDAAVVVSDNAEDLLCLDEALKKLASEDPQLAKLVELRYFAGVTIEETAKVLGISPRTTKRNWAYARAWLQREMKG